MTTLIISLASDDRRDSVDQTHGVLCPPLLHGRGQRPLPGGPVEELGRVQHLVIVSQTLLERQKKEMRGLFVKLKDLC